MADPARKPDLRLVPLDNPGNLERAISDFLDAKAVWRENTVKSYQSPLRLYAQHAGPRHWPPTDTSVNSFLAAARKRGLKESTIFSYYSALKTWLDWLYKRDRITYNPIGLIEAPRKPRPIPRVPDENDIDRLLKHLEAMASSGVWMQVRDLALLSLAFDTGMREGEIARLQLGDIDFSTRSIPISTDSKTHRGRVVKFSTVAARDMLRWVEKRKSLSALRNPPWGPIPASLKSTFVALGGKRKREWHGLTPDGIYQLLKRKLKQAGVDHFRFHSLRNAYLVYALRNGAELSDVMRQVGHRNLSTTAQYIMTSDVGRGERHEQFSPRVKKG